MAILFLLLLPPISAAQQQSLPETLHVQAITWQDGLAFNGTLRAIYASSPGAESPLGGAGEWGPSSLEIDYVDMTRVPGVAGVATDYGTTPHSLLPGPFTLTGSRNEPEILVHSNGHGSSVQFSASQGSLHLPRVDEITFNHVADPELPGASVVVPRVGLSGALELRGVDGPLLVQGDHEIALWGYDLDAGSSAYWSGEESQTQAESRRQLIRGTIADASGDYSVLDSDEVSLFLVEPTVMGKGTLELQAPRIPGAGDTPLGNRLELSGRVQVEVIGITESGMLLRVREAGTAQLDGNTVTIGESTSSNPWILAFSGMGVVVITALILVGVRTSPSHRLRKLEKRMQENRYPWVIRHAGPALRSERTAPKASLLKATSLLAMGEFKEARLFLASLGEAKRPDPATFHFLSAHAAAGLGQDGAAAGELAACLELEPSYIQEARTIEPLRRTLRQIMPEAIADTGESYA